MSTAQGTCPVCLAYKNLRKDGRMARHGSGVKNLWPPGVCAGQGEEPVEVQEKQ